MTLLTAVYPAMGLDFTVTTEMVWSLKSQGKATTSDAFAGVERVRMAAERSVSQNIAQGLTKISKLKL